MILELMTTTLLWGFGLAVIFGAIANKSNFCTMGAVSDWINIGDLDRMRSWFLAIAVATLGVGILEYVGSIDMSLTEANDTSNPPYRVSNFVWLRHLVGGVMFGVGMTLGSGCGNKTLVRVGEGNMKSLVVLIIMSLSASVMLFTSFDHWVFLQWMTPLSIDFSDYGSSSQDLASVIAVMLGSEGGAVMALTTALIVAACLLVWVLSSKDFRGNVELMTAGVIIGAVIVVAWYITAGSEGQTLLEEIDFLDERPYAAGAQSLSFVAPTAHSAQYIYQGFSSVFLTFGVMTVIGVIVGSFVYTLIFRKVRIEWFVAWDDFLRHVIGGILMGIGGVLAMGCTVGQGITGFSTLALGSILTLVSIIAGSAAMMKYQYYRMMREFDD